MKFVLFGLMAATVLVPLPAMAQLKPEMQTGSLIAARPEAVDPKQAGVIRKDFARCIFGRAKRKALALLQNADAQTVDLEAAKIVRVNEELRLDSCLGDGVSATEYALGFFLKRDALRDMLAEEAYLATNPIAPLVVEPAAPLEEHYVSTGENLDRAKEFTMFFDCAVRNDVANADALLRTIPGSQEERDLAVAMAPAFGGCLIEGQTVKLTPSSIRAFVAFGMWNRFGRGAAAK